jgi:hypothetical protein
MTVRSHKLALAARKPSCPVWRLSGDFGLLKNPPGMRFFYGRIKFDIGPASRLLTLVFANRYGTCQAGLRASTIRDTKPNLPSRLR